MTTVTGKLIGATSPQRVEMRAVLVDVTGKPAVGYVASVPGEVVRPVAITPESDGDWTVILTANSLIESDAGDTLWAIQEGRSADGTPIRTYVVVPATGGPYWAGEIRADLSDTITGGGTVVYLPGPAGPAGPEGEVGPEGPEGPQGETGPQPPLGAAGAGADIALRSTDPTTTNARTPTAHAASHATGGEDELAPADIGADPEGTAAAAVTTHAGASDPHGDRAAASSALATHAADTTDVHGIADTSALETTSGAQAKADAAQTAAATALSTHAADTTAVHGIADTTLLETATGAQTKADAAQSAATTAAATDATTKVTNHAGATDPHGDRAYATSTFATITTVSSIDVFLNDCLTRVSAIEGGTAWLNGVNSTGLVQVVGANLTVKRADNTGAYRFRVTGGGLDLEVGGLDCTVSHWSNADFTGTQKSLMRWESAGPHLIGRTQFGTTPFNTIHDLDAGTGVAGLGAKNGLTNIRLAGFKNSAGAPTTGAWAAGDVVLDSAGAWHLCTGAGSPGTWT